MENEIKQIYLSAEIREGESFDTKNGYTDVIVAMQNGDKWVASFFTYESIKEVSTKLKKEGGFLRGKYFWAKGMLLINECSKPNVELVIEDLLEEGLFKDVFWKL